MYTEQDFENARKLKKYEPSQYWELRKAGIFTTPFDFGCVDWSHNYDGKIDEWVPNDPNRPPLPEDFEDRLAVPVEKQSYNNLALEESQYNNCREGWSKRVDSGIVNDYWEHYDEWN